ncbi:MAG: hypothetical protein K9I85_15060 [Saprospiraceae bacterium]|nr:hypothetical protein [Saprospiraceae bacterium]
MKRLTKEQFTALANRDGGRCVSLFMPAHRSGQEVLNQEDRLNLKNLMKQISADLDNRGFDRHSIDLFMQPLVDLSKDAKFWHEQSEGLAIFMSREFFLTLHLPFAVDPFYYLSTEFYLKPLIPLLMGDGRFFLLTLSLDDLHLYEGDREGLHNLPLPQPLPRRMEQVVGSDVEETTSGHHGQFIHHGQGEGVDDRKEEILTYFREVDHRITEALACERAPLVLAGLDHLVALYRQTNHYAHLYPEAIAGNPQYEPRLDLHKKAWDLLAFTFDEERQVKEAQLKERHGTGNTSTNIMEIVPAALGGRVDTLFLDRAEIIWGTYDPKDAVVRLQDEQNLSNTDLGNLMANEVLLHGGKVYLTSREAMVDPHAPINALYRY